MIEFEDSNKVITFAKREIFGCTECGSVDFQIESEQTFDEQRICQIICSNTSCRTVYPMDSGESENN